MNKYSNKSGISGVEAYKTGSDYIRVRFHDNNSLYTYTYASAGKKYVERMKALAREGKGLSTYISRYVRENYER